MKLVVVLSVLQFAFGQFSSISSSSGFGSQGFNQFENFPSAGFSNNFGGNFPSQQFGFSPGFGESSSFPGFSNGFGGSFPSDGFGGGTGGGFPLDTDSLTQSPLEKFLMESECRKGCEDRSMVCATLANKCENGLKGVIIQQMCPRTCGTCSPCPLLARKCVADGSCTDRLPTCKILAGMQKCSLHYSSQWVRKMCPESCGECITCPKPTDPGPECTPNCRDNQPACSRWAHRYDYCNDATFKPWMEANCKKSCEMCKLCTKPTLKPPKPFNPSNGRSLTLNSAPKTHEISIVVPQNHEFPLRTRLTNFQRFSYGFKPPQLHSPFVLTGPETTTTKKLLSTTTLPMSKQTQLQQTSKPTDEPMTSTEDIASDPTTKTALAEKNETAGFGKNCTADCIIGSCSGDSETPSDCYCVANSYGVTTPGCEGRCKAHCQKPPNFKSVWRTTCEGKKLCTCSYTTNPTMKLPAGAWCM